MRLSRTLEFAAVQAKLRARIGKMPDERTWQRFAQSGSSGHDDLHGSGLDYWLQNIPREYTINTLERHFNGRIRELMKLTAELLPDNWSDFGLCLYAVPDIFLLRIIMKGDAGASVLDQDSTLHGIIGLSPGRRLSGLDDSHLAPFLIEPEHSEEIWRRELLARIPALRGTERLAMERLKKILVNYSVAKTVQFNQIAAAGRESVDTRRSTGFSPGAWLAHRDLERRLKLSLAGDPFHPALILVYSLLELLNMERLKALLISRQLGWSAPAALKGVA